MRTAEHRNACGWTILRKGEQIFGEAVAGLDEQVQTLLRVSGPRYNRKRVRLRGGPQARRRNPKTYVLPSFNRQWPGEV